MYCIRIWFSSIVAARLECFPLVLDLLVLEGSSMLASVDMVYVLVSGVIIARTINIILSNNIKRVNTTINIVHENTTDRRLISTPRYFRKRRNRHSNSIISSDEIIERDCPTRIPDETTIQNCQTKLWDKTVRQDGQTRQSDDTVRRGCPRTLSHTIVRE